MALALGYGVHVERVLSLNLDVVDPKSNRGKACHFMVGASATSLCGLRA